MLSNRLMPVLCQPRERGATAPPSFNWGELRLDTPWRKVDPHRRWLMNQADRLFAFYEAESLDPAGGFFTLDAPGRPIPSETERPLHQTSRMAHCAAIG